MEYSEEQRKSLISCPLFAGTAEGLIIRLLDRAGAQAAYFAKNSPVLEQGEQQEGIYLVLTGRARGERLTSDGRLVTVNEFGPGELFGEILSGAHMDSPVTVRMLEDGSVLRLSLGGLINALPDDRGTGERVLRNLIGQISVKYFALTKRVEMLLCPTLAGKIAMYLLNQREGGSNSVTVPHSREEQAALLNCDRSALSRELSRLRATGIINYFGRSFDILDEDRLRGLIQ